MKRKLIFTLTASACLLLSSLWPSLDKKEQKPVVTMQKTTKTKPPTPKVLSAKTAPEKAVDAQTAPKKVAQNKPLKTVISKNNTLKQVSFDDLPGWNDAEIKKSMLAFQKSCDAFLKQKPDHKVGSQLINLKAKDWHPACKEALTIDSTKEESAKIFFEKWFYPIELANKPTRSLFTGYYMPQLKGNLTRTEEFNTPIYGLPKSRYLPYYTREEIDNGALKTKAPVIAWINSPIERLFLEIEGSGVIKLTNGKQLYLGYAGENGAPYSSISKVLINKGIMTKDKASKKAIKRYLESEPKKAKALMHENKSFVFFQKLGTLFGLGAKDIALTPGYSLAIDKKWIPMGAPLWLNTTIPDQHNNSDKQFQRLMIAQDTGGAIKGLMRGDIYWGSGKRAAFLGENMKNSGHYWLLLPKQAFDRLAGSFHSRF